MMLRVTVGTHQKESLQCAGFLGDDAPHAVLPFIVVPENWFFTGK